MKYTDIAWDFDGTLYNSYPHVIRCIQQLLDKYGCSDTEENIANLVHVSTALANRKYAPLCGVSLEEFGVEYRRLSYDVVSDLVQPYPGIPELLKDLTAAGYRNHLCTNRAYVSCKRYFERDGLDVCFDVYSGPDAAPGLKGKPHPDLVRFILDRREIDPSRLLMVGDRNLDVIASHAAGGKGCFMDLDGYSVPECDPEYLAESVEDLRKILLG